MRRATSIVALCVLALPSAACRAQEAFEYSWEVKDVAGTGPTNANGIIEPGEDAQIFFNVSFRPGVGGTAVWDTLGGTGQPGIVAGIALVYGEMVSDLNLNTGQWLNIGYRSGFNLGIGGSIEPDNSLRGWGFGQFVFPGETPNPANDTWFFWARWRPINYAHRNVLFHFENFALVGGGMIEWPSAYLDIIPPGTPRYNADLWSHNQPSGGFVVVPAPSAGFALAALCFSRRRRRYSH
ncbi:MAG: hypothetical protein ACKVW3_10625 [Phycisphaerales bacterium]